MGLRHPVGLERHLLKEKQMSRPLNKKYFGNRNVGSASTTADDRIGGEGIASINWSNRGSWLSTAGGAAAPLAGLQLPAPTLPGGVQATWTNYFGAAAVTTGAGSVGLVVGETYTYAPIPGLLVTVATSGNNGTNATFTVTNAGSTTTLLTDLQTVNLTKSAGMTGAATFTVDIFLKVVDTVIGEPGSGYTGDETFTVTLANGAAGTVPAGTIVLTEGSNTNAAENPTGTNEDAIIGYAYIDGGREVVDIVAQKGSKRYIVKGASGTINTAKLIPDTAGAEGEMEIRATDSDGGTYWVTKLTSRLAVVEPDTGTQFASGQRVKWNLTGAVEDVSVEVDNA